MQGGTKPSKDWSLVQHEDQKQAKLDSQAFRFIPALTFVYMLLPSNEGGRTCFLY